ncbi:hypothetical protein GGF46_004169, partial [Coemansia sp. RSA 552]
MPATGLKRDGNGVGEHEGKEGEKPQGRVAVRQAPGSDPAAGGPDPDAPNRFAVRQAPGSDPAA